MNKPKRIFCLYGLVDEEVTDASGDIEKVRKALKEYMIDADVYSGETVICELVPLEIPTDIMTTVVSRSVKTREQALQEEVKNG